METASKTVPRALSRSQAGMTLIEIMVVIAIIGIVAGAVGYGVTKYLFQARIDACKAQLDNIANHIVMYEATHGEYPAGLNELTKKEKGKGGAFLKNSQTKDPWKQKIDYAVDGDGFTLCSSGPDKRKGSDDDICYGGDDEETAGE